MLASQGVCPAGIKNGAEVGVIIYIYDLPSCNRMLMFVTH